MWQRNVCAGDFGTLGPKWEPNSSQVVSTIRETGGATIIRVVLEGKSDYLIWIPFCAIGGIDATPLGFGYILCSHLMLGDEESS